MIFLGKNNRAIFQNHYRVGLVVCHMGWFDLDLDGPQFGPPAQAKADLGRL